MRTSGPSGFTSIHVIRHGHPHIRNPKSCRRAEYRVWTQAYAEVDIHPKSLPAKSLRSEVDGSAMFVCSELLRSVTSGERLAGSKPIHIVPDLNEVQLPVPPLPYITLSGPTWVGVASLLHRMGYAVGGESQRTARRRAERAADTVLELGSKHGAVAVVAHGLINQMLIAALEDREWSITASGGAQYWAWTRLEPVVGQAQ